MTNHGISTNHSFRRSSGPSSSIQRFFQHIGHWFTQGEDVQVHKSINRRTGQPHWRVFDPSTGRSAVLFSEQDVVTWLEDRYSYRNPPDWMLNYRSLR